MDKKALRDKLYFEIMDAIDKNEWSYPKVRELVQKYGYSERQIYRLRQYILQNKDEK